ncbi:MAG: peptidase T [Planctomycetota bacterium]|nr:peptidase T [Planctomycetota bacterium]
MHPSEINRQKLLHRFLQYVRVGSAADPASASYPSSVGQLELGIMLVEQLLEMGVSDAYQDEHGLIWGTVPSNVDGDAPTVLLNAHLDTSPEAPGDGCNPQVVENYDGNSITLLSGDTIDLISTPELASLRGHTLVTTDGKTLLGADDKAGVATIMQCVQYWMENPNVPHGPVRVLFTCDEEIGKGTKHFDLHKAGAIVGYTLDGGAAGTIDVETFSADGATVTFHGRNTHPSVAKGKMLNSLRAAAKFIALLPTETLSPESTSDRQGFVHPFTIQGGAAETSIQFIVRDFETRKLEMYIQLLKTTMDRVLEEFPGMEGRVNTVVQYRNMADVLRGFPKAIELAEQAYADLKFPCRRDSIRGGTDGALMSELGLPTPNLSVGQFNIHSVREFASLDHMVQAAQHVIRLVELWSLEGLGH